MAAFYKSNEGYAHQQASHTAAYFHRLLGVMDAVLAQPHLSLLEIGAGSAVAMQDFSRQAPRCESRCDGAFAGVDPRRETRQRAVAARSRRQCARASVSGSLARCGRCVRGDRASSRRGAALSAKCCVSCGAPDTSSSACRITRRSGRRSKIACGAAIGARLASNAAAARGDGSSETRRLRGESDSHRARSFCIASRFCTRPPAAMPTPSTTLRRSICCDSFASRGAALVTSSARLRFGWAGRLLPVEFQGSTVMAWRVTDRTAQRIVSRSSLKTKSARPPAVEMQRDFADRRTRRIRWNRNDDVAIAVADRRDSAARPAGRRLRRASIAVRLSAGDDARNTSSTARGRQRRGDDGASGQRLHERHLAANRRLVSRRSSDQPGPR